MLLFWLTAQLALGCTEDTTGRVVGFDAAGTRALLRVERRVNDDDLALDLVLLDLESGRTVKRYVILAYEDDNDAALRGSRWKAAEAELVSQGIVIDPTLEPHARLGPSSAIAVPDTQGVVAVGQRPASETEHALVAAVHHGPEVVDRTELARWHRDSGSNSVTYPEAAWTTPRPGTVLIQTAQGCSDPEFHVVHVPTGPAEGPTPAVWCTQLLTADNKALRCGDPAVTTVPDPHGLPVLEKLDLRDSGIADLALVGRFPTLEVLDLTNTSASDLGPLSALTALRKLDLENTPVTDIGPLAGLPLTNLDLSGTEVPDLTPLTQLPKLKSVGLDPARHDEAKALRGDLRLYD